MTQLLRLLLCALLALSATPGPACAQGSENVLLVVNGDSADSLELANHYIALRDIPPINVVYLHNVRAMKKTGNEGIASKYYRSDIFEPTMAAIKARCLEDQIDCITYSAGFPTRVIAQTERDRYLSAVGKKYDIHFHAPFVSLNSATFFGNSLFATNPDFLDTHSNWYALGLDAPTRTFSNRTYWTKNGQTTLDPNNGRRYRLSTLLAVVRPDGSTIEQAIMQLERSVAADGSKPDGEFYFAGNKDPRSRTRKQQYAGAAAVLKELGYKVEIAKGVLPKNKTVLGATLGTAKTDWTKSKSKFAQGAFCDNFTSYGAWWEKKQTKLTHFLNNGAAASVGMVYEPYTIPYKIPTAYVHVHYVRGCTIAESIYQTVLNPFQMLVVGDPLCRPFADFPKFTVTGIQDKSVVESDLNLAIETTAGTPKLHHIDTYLDGRLKNTIKPGQPIELPFADLTPGYHRLRIVAVAESISRASTTKSFGFFVRGEGPTAIDLRLKVQNTTVSPNGKVIVSCDVPQGVKVELWQNHRLIGEFKSSKKPLSIAASVFGQGETEIYAVASVAGNPITGVPLMITIK